MRRLFLGLFFVVCFLVFMKVGLADTPSAQKKAEPLSFAVLEKPAIHNTSKIGINLGRMTSGGTQQFATNIVFNPGFEGKVERTIVIVSERGEESFSDEAGLGYPDNTWNEASYDIRTGPSAGKKGVIKKSLNSGHHGFPQYFTVGKVPQVEAGDVVVLTKESRLGSPSHWKVNHEALVRIDPYETRKESKGRQSILLMPTKTNRAELQFFADKTAEKTGKMVRVIGPWSLSFWAKSSKDQAKLQVTFQRGDKGILFLNQTLSLSSDWRRMVLDFSGDDSGSAEPLVLTFVAEEPDVSIWIDDLLLSSKNEEAAPFRKEVVDAIQELSPSYIREFPPLGNTWENHMAEPFKRMSWVYRVTAGKSSDVYGYSLSEFLDLCKKVKANPWIIIPPVYSDYELREMGAYLAYSASKNIFSDVIVEFGADSWNWLYRPLAIPYEEAYGEAADRAFSLIEKETKGKVNIRFFVNGEFQLPQVAPAYITSAKQADGMSVSPYFFPTLDKATPDREILKRLFDENSSLMSHIADNLFPKRKLLAVSEINLSTTKGTARAYERNRLVAGRAAGAALARKLLESLYAGADPILVHSLGQYDTPAWEIDDFVQLWGVVRDFGPPLVFRPTGLAVVMLNSVIGGSMHALKHIDGSKIDAITAAGFKTPEGWKAAVVSGSEAPQTIEILFPDDKMPLPKTYQTLSSASPFDTNESEENVRILSDKPETDGRKIRLTIPPWSFAILM